MIKRRGPLDHSNKTGEPAAPYDARALANLILDVADSSGVEITQMKLHKLLYFAHGWYLHEFAAPLVWNPFEAWEHGPVVKVLHDAFKPFGKAPIVTRAVALDFVTGERVRCVEPMRETDRAFVEAVVREYFRHSALELSDMTHEKGSPWDSLWNNPQPIGRFALRIRDEDIKKAFDMAAEA